MTKTFNRFHQAGKRTLVSIALVVGCNALATDLPAGAALPADAQAKPEQIYSAIFEAEQKRRELWRPDPAVPNALSEKWGVQVIGVNRTAGGYWLDFRFRVVDATKAGMLFDYRHKPYLEHDGAKLGVPMAAKVGALRTTNRQGNIRNGKIYTIMFSNPGTRIETGDKVTVVAGKFRVERLTVN